MPGATVFTGTIYHELKETLDSIMTDASDGISSKMLMPQICEETTQDDNWADDIDIAFPAYVTEKPEGQAMSVGSVQEGTIWHYQSRTFGMQLSVTREAVEDNKYRRAFDYGKALKTAATRTVDFDATGFYIDMFNSAVLGGDGVSLCSASHPLPNGDTYSNIAATGMTPSPLALTSVIASLMSMPGIDGTPEGYEAEAIVCPVAQWAIWKQILGSSMDPTAGNFTAINVVNDSHGGTVKKVIPNKYWTNTTTDWAVRTNAPKGLRFKWLRKPTGNDWMDNAQDVFNYGVTYRAARNWSNPRAIFGVDN